MTEVSVEQQHDNNTEAAALATPLAQIRPKRPSDAGNEFSTGR